MTLTVIGFLAVVILVLDYVNRVPGEEQPAPAGPPAQPGERPPLWVFPVTLLIVAVVMLVLAWYWPE
ncbi:MAG: hypothetical protein ACKODX_04915 [Gemmata sp.]